MDFLLEPFASLVTLSEYLVNRLLYKRKNLYCILNTSYFQNDRASSREN